MNKEFQSHMLNDSGITKCIEEINRICDKYDVGASIFLSTRLHGEHLFHFPTWSKVLIEKYKGQACLHFKAKSGEKEDITSTVHMIQLFKLQGDQITKGMDELLEILESKMFISGGPQRLKDNGEEDKANN